MQKKAARRIPGSGPRDTQARSAKARYCVVANDAMSTQFQRGVSPDSGGTSVKIFSTIGLAAATVAIFAGTATAGLADGQSSKPDFQMHGIVSSFNGRYDLHLQDPQGNVTDVHLHPGTVIRPRGLDIERGMHVIVSASNSPSSGALVARQIDAPNYYSERVVVGPAYSLVDGYSYLYGTPTRRTIAVKGP